MHFAFYFFPASLYPPHVSALYKYIRIYLYTPTKPLCVISAICVQKNPPATAKFSNVAGCPSVAHYFSTNNELLPAYGGTNYELAVPPNQSSTHIPSPKKSRSAAQTSAKP
jgi:hypothetical protein